jgi:protein SERAC1
MKSYKNYELIEDSSGKKVLFKSRYKNNKNLVVFVHGFTGNYLSTWGAFPELLTGDPRLMHFDFLFWGYSSNLIFHKEDFLINNIRQLFTQVLSKHKTNQHIEIVAQGLQTELKYLDEYDNITLIGHSLGGLVIRSYIIQNLKGFKKENQERIKKINQIILFGTPNEGLDIANNKILRGINSQIILLH